MADTIINVRCGFFDSVSRDRLYSADEMNRPYKRIITNGVFATPAGTPSTDLQVLSNQSGMSITIKRGEGLFADKWFENPSDIILTVPNNTNIVPRRDSIVVQVDKRINGRTGNIIYRTGVPNSNPMPPDINTVQSVIEYRIANIYVAAGAIAINQDAIVDLRGSSECPWVTSLIHQVDTSTLFLQWQTAYQNYYNTATSGFDEWKEAEREAFEAFMESLTSELTVNTTVAKYESHYVTPTAGTTVIPINIETFDKMKDVLMVRINDLFVTETIDYVISNDNTQITLTKDLDANQNISFLVLQSLVVGDTATVLQQLQQLNTTIGALNSDSGWINFTLESGATAFDATTVPAVRKFGNAVYVRGAIKNLDAVNSPIATLPTNMRPAMNHQYAVTAFANGQIAANCVIEIKANGQIVIVAKSGTIPVGVMLPIATKFVLG